MERKRTPPTSAQQIIQHFYSKVAQVIAWARQEPPPTHHHTHNNSSHQKRVNKWFNLELEELDAFRENLRYWRSAAASSEPPPPLVIELYLDISELSQQQQVLVLVDENQRRNRVETGWNSPSSNGGRQSPSSGGFQPKKSILLESWQLTLSPPPPHPAPELPVVYKKCIIFFRSLYSYARLLPSYRLFRKLRARHRTNALKMGCRLSTVPTFRDDEIGIDVPLTNSETRSTTSAHRFSPIETPLGTLELSVISRAHCDFQIDDAEAIMSSRFIDMDENYFTPTMAKEQMVYDQRVQRARSQQTEEEERKRMRNTQRASSISGTLHNLDPPDHSQQPPPLRRFSTRSDHSASPLYNRQHLQTNNPPTSITPDVHSQSGSGSASAASSYGPVPVFFPEHVQQDIWTDAAISSRSADTCQRVYSKTVGSYSRQSTTVPFGTSPPPFSTKNVNVAPRRAGSEGEASMTVLTSASPPIKLIATGTSPSSPGNHPGSLVRRPSVTFLSPFKSPPLSSSASPRSSTDFFPSSSSFSPKNAYSSSSLLRSNSITSIESQTNPAHPPVIRSRPTSISNPIRLGTTPPSIASSHTSIRSVGVAGSPGPSKLSSSFGYRYATPNGTAGRAAKTSTKSDDGSESGSARQRGSSSSSFFASQTEHDGLTDFVKMIDTRKQLKMFAKKELDGPVPIGQSEQSEYFAGDEPIGSHEGGAGMHTSVQKSKLALSRFHQLQAYNNKISDSLSSSMLLAQSPIEEGRQISSKSPRIPSSSSSPSSSASFTPKSNTNPHTQHTCKNPTSSLSTIPSSSTSTSSSSASLPSPFDSNGPVPVRMPSATAQRPIRERGRSFGGQESLGEDRKESGCDGRQLRESLNMVTSVKGEGGRENTPFRILHNVETVPDGSNREECGRDVDADRGRPRDTHNERGAREFRFSSSTMPPPSTTTRLQHYRRSTSPVLSPSYRTRLAGPSHPLGSVAQSRTERRRGSTGSSDSFSGIPCTKSLEEDDDVLLFTMSELSTGGGLEGSSGSVSPTAPREFGTQPRNANGTFADGSTRVRAKFGTVKRTPW